MNLNKKIYITLSIFLAICFVFIFFLIYPAIANIKSSSDKILNIKNDLFSLSEKENKLNEGEEFYNIYEKDIKKKNELLVDARIPVEFVRFLENMANELNLSIEISSLSVPEKKDDFWPSLALSVTTDGSFNDSMRFLDKLENAPYLIEIINLRINKSKEQDLNFEFLYSIKTFTK